ncbi:PIN domain-containing protein [Brachybacterium sp. UNK5269]|uniref:PIN domain-containing protein n=1 Tax=Brachybacterium sp. UNK5269 TaxID=3408576 RepID=UPI003BAF40EB
MTRRPAVVLDACVLIPLRLATTLLWLAEADLFTPLWSEEILDEVEKNLPDVASITAAQAARRVSQMREGFGAEAMVEGYEHLVSTMTNHPKDRHVLAAAVEAEADIIVTDNIRDFPEQAVAPHGITVLRSEDFLLMLLDESPQQVVDTLEREVAAFRKPVTSLPAFLGQLTYAAPTFANLAADIATEPDPAFRSPVPALTEASMNEARKHYGPENDPTHPAQIAMTFMDLLAGGELKKARTLTFDPGAFGDCRWAQDLLAGRGLANKVLYAVDAPEDLAFMRFVPAVATNTGAAQAFATFLTSMIYMTLVRLTDGTWRVWGLGGAMVSAAQALERKR